MTDLVEFLLARIAEDEEAAKATPPGFGGDTFADRFSTWESDHSVEDSAFVDRFDPARVLAECEAKRRIIELHKPDNSDSGCSACDINIWRDEQYPCETLLALALPYADHPGYRPEWRP